jgi:hypothetical protein
MARGEAFGKAVVLGLDQRHPDRGPILKSATQIARTTHNWIHQRLRLFRAHRPFSAKPDCVWNAGFGMLCSECRLRNAGCTAAFGAKKCAARCLGALFAVVSAPLAVARVEPEPVWGRCFGERSWKPRWNMLLRELWPWRDGRRAGLALSLLAGSIAAVVVVPGLVARSAAQSTAAGDKHEKPPEWPAGARVGGRVVDHDGRPCADAEVLLLGSQHIIVDADRRKWFIVERDQRGEPVPTATTDEHGEFVLQSRDESANRIVVISPEVLLWVASRKDLGRADDVVIKLPQPGRLAVKVDLPEKPKKLPIHIELRTFDDVDWTPDPLRFHMAMFKVDNPGETVFKSLPPARYAVERVEETSMGEHTNMMTQCERQLVQVQSGKQATVTFEHAAGTMVEGHVKGLEDVKLAYATVTIGYFGPEEEPGKNGKRVRYGTSFEVIPIKPDGHFLTDAMPPGEYDFRLFAVRATTPQGPIQSSEFEGQAQLTISGKRGTQQLEIVATPPGTRRAKRKGPRPEAAQPAK